MIRTASDGLPARLSGPWTQEKLRYVQKYAAAFTRAMTPKRRAGLWSELVYLDLLSGPGWGIDRASGEEFSCSPLRALGVTPGFDRLFFGDLEPANVIALNQRIRPEDRPRVVLRPGDCHEIAAGIVLKIWEGVTKIGEGDQRRLL